MKHVDKYSSLEELKLSEPPEAYREYARDKGSWLTIVAPHAGTIEPFTGQLAEAIAGQEHNLFVFEGLRGHGTELHVTSARFSSVELTALQTAEQSRITISVHGASDAWADRPTVFIGGQNSELRRCILLELSQASFSAVDAALNGPPQYAATDPENFVNKTKEAGIQLEISRRLRTEIAGSPARMNQFSEAVRSGIERFYRLT
jgi:phage replication-related protein YjqB (UPF0714/DUF867 family)